MCIRAAYALILFVVGCAPFPRTEEEGVVEIRNFTGAIECELAAVANNPDPYIAKRNFRGWKALTDLDLTLVRTVGADGKVVVTAPYHLATVSATPSLGLTGTDTSIAHVEFAPGIAEAAKEFGQTCAGSDPSETQMGLAIWITSALYAVNQNELAGITYTKQFEIVATAGARFGYTLLPVTNTVNADVGGSGTYDRASRLTIAVTPPVDSTVKPIPVYIVTPKGKEEVALPLPAPSPASSRARAIGDPVLQYLLQRKSPVKIGP